MSRGLKSATAAFLANHEYKIGHLAEIIVVNEKNSKLFVDYLYISILFKCLAKLSAILY